MKKAFVYLFLTVTFLALSACKDRHEYRVPSDFAVYVESFEEEAAARGRLFNLKTMGLIIEFSNLKDNVAGLCHYEKPIRIEMDKEYWDKIGRYANADILREELLFHEMGHGLLHRHHTNDILANNEWKSMMCGGDSVSGRTWNINYRGERRRYYLDELFNESAGTPDFVSYLLPIDTARYADVLSDNFDDAASSIWKIRSYNDSHAVFENGMLRFQSESSVSLMVLAKINTIDVQSDFCLEFNLKYSGTNPKARYGIAFGAANGDAGAESMDYLLINNLKKMIVGNNSCYSYFTQVTRNQIIESEMNKLKVYKQGEMLYFFLNDKYVYCSEIENKQTGFHFGFMAPSKATLYVDNFRIGQRQLSTAPSAVKTKKISDTKINVEITNANVTEKQLNKQ